MSNRRTGKIARLPKETRDAVNAMLRDGRTYADIIAEVGGGEEGKDLGLNEQNLTNWKNGGFQDWLKEQERLEDMKAKREFALEIVRQNQGTELHQASLQLAASQAYEALSDFDPEGLKLLLREKPENFVKIINGLSKLSGAALDVEKYKEQIRQRKEAIEKEIGAAKREGGLTAEAIARIEAEVKLL